MSKLKYFVERLKEEGIQYQTEFYDTTNVIFIPRKTASYMAVVERVSYDDYEEENFAFYEDEEEMVDYRNWYPLIAFPSKYMIEEFRLVNHVTHAFNPLFWEVMEYESKRIYTTDGPVNAEEMIDMALSMEKRKYTPAQLIHLPHFVEYHYGDHSGTGRCEDDYFGY